MVDVKIDINPVNMLNRMMEKVSPLTKYNKALSSDKKLYFKSNHLIHSLLNDNGLLCFVIPIIAALLAV